MIPTKRLIFFITMISALSFAHAQNSSKKNIFETLATPDSSTQARVKVIQDPRIEQQLNSRRAKSSDKASTVSGYRVQVFSDNAQRSAKADANRIGKMIEDAFPEQTVYINYIAPFWKVRVGDFRTQAQAQAFRTQLIDVLPQLRTEVYIVREQIVASNLK